MFAVLAGGLLLHSVGKAETSAQGEEMIRETLCNGTALERFEMMLVHQNVKADVAAQLCSANYAVLPRSKYITVFRASSSGSYQISSCFFFPKKKMFRRIID